MAQAFLEIKKYQEAVSLFFYIEKQLQMLEKILADTSTEIPQEDTDFMKKITVRMKADKCRAQLILLNHQSEEEELLK